VLLLASPRTHRAPAAAPGPPPGRPARPARGRSVGTRAVLAGGALLALALVGYAAEVAAHPLPDMLTWFDLRVYVAAGHTAVHAPAMLYRWPMMPGFQFTYTPFAALVFAGWAWVPWGVLTWLMTAAGLAALGLAGWLTLGGLGWAGKRRLAGALTVSAVALWTEPVQRTLHLGQVELLLMALVVWDLCLADRRWWKGAGIGLAAGIKLVPLIFIPYLLLTRRFRQAAVATVTFGALAGLGFTVLPQASWQWWFGPDFLRAGRTGFVGFLANQSLRGMFTRQSGSLAGGLWWWAAAAGLAAVAGLITAARLHRAGRPVHGWLTCALTGLIVSPVSWDHHWVWLAPALAVLADAAIRAARAARWACWAAAAALAGLFGAWPMLGRPGPLVPWGLIWYAPGSGAAGSHPWNSEYHWHGAAWLAGNLYILAGLVSFAALAVLARRCVPVPAVPRRAAPPPGVQYLLAQPRTAPPATRQAWAAQPRPAPLRADWPRAGPEDHLRRRPISLVE
jgi:alpha-1,2-mannosyltransferase